MSTGTIKTQGENQLHVEYDISKIFVFSNRYETETLLNASGGVKTFLPGTLLGRVSASLKLVPVASGASDGSEIPVGILATEVTDLADTSEETVQVCISGDVVESKLILDGSDTVDTLIDGRP
ncbi:MAG: head decoration protein, partial [Candidatus Diapherotrites archaeon]|nr:head decoration protein [Candidatus Diapherotrites archaeon]